jgi:hypothetical protein
LHQQSEQTDTVDGEDEKYRDLHAGTTFVFLLQQRTLRDEWTLVIHIVGR